MRFRNLIKEIEKWVKEQRLGEVKYATSKEFGTLFFEVRTTKTRASSIVTRLGLMIADIVADQHEFKVSHELMSDYPQDRDDLATWKISTTISKKKLKPIAA